MKHAALSLKTPLLAIALIGLTGCSSAESPSSTKTASSPIEDRTSDRSRRVILFNDAGPSVLVGKDMEALNLVIEYLKFGSETSQLRMRAAQMDGRLFELANGTEATVVREARVSSTRNISVLTIAILSGAHFMEGAMCFSTVVRPKKGRIQ